MKILIAVFIALVFLGCSGGKTSRVDLYIPQINENNTGNIDILFVQAWKDLQSGNADQAYKKLKQSRAADDCLHVGYGYVYLYQQKTDLAKHNFLRALELNRENFIAQIGLAVIDEILGDSQGAYQKYTQLLIKYPQNAWIKVRYDFFKSVLTQKCIKEAENYLRNGDKTLYIESLIKGSMYSPEIIDIKKKIAEFYYEQNDLNKAALYYEEILNKLPTQEDIIRKLADIYERTEKLETSLLMFNKLKEINPTDDKIVAKIQELREKFYNLDLPANFKNIFFKESVNREDMAALIGYYFQKYLMEKVPVIITDIAGSYAKDFIIKICALGIMNLNPDHSFNRFEEISRSDLALIAQSLLKYLEGTSLELKFVPIEVFQEPADISPQYQHYNTIHFLISIQLIQLDEGNLFNPARLVTPNEVLTVIKKIIFKLNQQKIGTD